MPNYCVFTIALLLHVGALRPMQADDNSAALRAAFKTHCIECHGESGESEGEIDLVELQNDGEFLNRPELLEELVTVLEDRRMPPEGNPPVPAAQRAKLIAQLKSLLAQSLKSQPFLPTPIRRMNRFQYNNAVVDLLDLDRDIFQLNERLLRRRDDYFRPASRRMPEQVRVSCRPLSKDIDNQRPEGFRGVAAFPQDQRAEHGFDNRADHLTLSPLLMESFLQLSQSIVDSPDLNAKECHSWNRLFGSPEDPELGSANGRYEAEHAAQIKVIGTPQGRAASQALTGLKQEWSGDAHLFWQCPDAGDILTLSFEMTEQASGLRLRLTTARDYGRFQISVDGEKKGNAIDLYSPEVIGIVHEIEGLNLAVGRHTLAIQCLDKHEASTGHFFGLDYIELTGRETPTVAERPVAPDIEVVRERLRKLLRRAFRRPVSPETLDQFSAFAEDQLASGASVEETMRTLVGAVLAMPDFLYFYEAANESENHSADAGRQRIDEFELATRLAQFFWSSIPDDTLLDLAEAEKLSDPAILNEQIDRMLDDRRSSRFCDNFPSQWLQLDRLITSIPDPQAFPHFYFHGYRTSMHMIAEPLLLFETVFIEDRSIIDLIDPKFTWQSEMLAANYAGRSNAPADVQVQVVRRVPLDDPRRGGVIINAAVMTMTSTPTRTQPITRGAWINEVIFNDPPEPPPADVPPLPENNAEELAKLTIRERLAVHRQRADCAGCHDKIDPLGFALENYDPTGVWRDKYENGRDVDASGLFFNQHEFATPVEFKQLIAQDKKRFTRAFAAHLLSYALGRELGPADSPALDEITAEAMSGNDSLRTILKSIAGSEPFLHKNTSGSIADHP